MPRVSSRWKCAGGAMLAAAMILASCKKEAAPAAAMAARPPARVTATAAITRDVPLYLDAIGRMVATESVSVMPQVGGKLIAVHVDDGVSVKKGDLLFEIDPRPYEASVAAAKASLAQAKADLAFARIDYTRVAALLPTAAASQLEADERKTAVEVNEAKVAGAEAALETANLNLAYCKITSPIGGRAGALLVDPGNIVRANEQALINLQRLDPIFAEFTITENDLGTVRKFLVEHGMQIDRVERGIRAIVQVPADSVRMRAALAGAAASTRATAATRPALEREGQITFLDNTVEAATGTVKLRASLENGDSYFWPGQFVNVKIILASKRDAVLIPVQAEQIAQQGAFVYVLAADGTAQLRPIVPGQRQGDLLVVESGVKAGEQVITSGQMLVMPGGKVQLVSESGGAAGPATSPVAAK